MKRLLALAFLFSLTAACGPKCPPRGRSANAVSPPAVDVLIAAFNRADAEALIATTHPDVEWMFVQGEEIAVETRGQDALRASMTQSALAVYELTDGKIRRIWYYPEQP